MSQYWLTICVYAEQTPAREWRWTLESTNGRIIASSGEGWRSRTRCVDNLRLLLGRARKFTLIRREKVKEGFLPVYYEGRILAGDRAR